jgi:acetylornithine deacetylase/succinyl-diaminopimelate desuccinylase-like protein
MPYPARTGSRITRFELGACQAYNIATHKTLTARTLSTERSPSIEILRKLVEFPTFEEPGMHRCAEYLSGELAKLGFRTNLDKLGNVFGTRTYERGNGTFLINAHFDTVPSTPSWVRDPLRVSLEGNRLYGLGVSDDKGSVAAVLHVLSKLTDCRFRRLEVLFSNYEDNSVVLDDRTWLGTPYFLEHKKLESESGINVEGTVKNGRLMVAVGCGGRVGFDVTTIGKQAHSSDPRLGRNAIYDMVKVIEALRKVPPARMTIDEYEAYTELNVSVIQGGIAINIVPGECTITCERRVLPNEDWDQVKKMVDEALASVKDVNLKASFRPPQRSYLLDRNHPVVKLAIDGTQQALGYTPKLRVESGRTDSIYFDQLGGIKTVILGPGETAHIPDEYINVKRLEEFSDVLYHMLSRRS